MPSALRPKVPASYLNWNSKNKSDAVSSRGLCMRKSCAVGSEWQGVFLKESCPGLFNVRASAMGIWRMNPIQRWCVAAVGCMSHRYEKKSKVRLPGTFIPWRQASLRFRVKKRKPELIIYTRVLFACMALTAHWAFSMYQLCLFMVPMKWALVIFFFACLLFCLI